MHSKKELVSKIEFLLIFINKRNFCPVGNPANDIKLKITLCIVHRL